MDEINRYCTESEVTHLIPFFYLLKITMFPRKYDQIYRSYNIFLFNTQNIDDEHPNEEKQKGNGNS